MRLMENWYCQFCLQSPATWRDAVASAVASASLALVHMYSYATNKDLKKYVVTPLAIKVHTGSINDAK